MDSAKWTVLIAALGAIAWVNWYFFFAPRKAVQARTTGERQEVEIAVKGGYEPAVVRLKRDVPARLVFNRQETSSCSEEVVLSAFNIRKYLPAFAKTAIEITPTQTGTFDITCGMSMLHGKVVVED